MTTDAEPPRPRQGSLVPLAIIVGSTALAAVLEPLRTALVGTGPLVPSGQLGFDELAFAAITAVGDGPGLVALVGLVAIILVAARRLADAAFVVIAVGSASLITRVVKDLYHAPRPLTVDQASHLPTSVPGELVIAIVVVGVIIGILRGRGLRALVGGGIVLAVLLLERITDALVPTAPGLDSYPSGHAMSAATLAAVVILVTWRDVRWRLPIGISATATAFAIGLSRIYLGVHYPADVIGGWCLGIAWVSACWLGWTAIRQRWSVRDRPSLETVD